jgi:hypothetical protein
MRRISVGIIAEDHSDVDVVAALIRKVGRKPFQVRQIVGNGCGKIIGKCRAWATNLQNQGCRYLFVVHDLDTRILDSLRSDLVSALVPFPFSFYLIVIPVREIEAWLLADHVAIEKAMKIKETLKAISNPEAIQRPKEYLADLVYRKSKHKKRYVNAVHNVKNCGAVQGIKSEKMQVVYTF